MSPDDPAPAPTPAAAGLPAGPVLRAADLRGLAQLATDGVLGVTGVVESMHRAVQRVGGLLGDPAGRTSGLTGLVYGAVRGGTRLAGRGLDVALRALPADDAPREPAREAWLAALNGVWGDHLVATGNPLAITTTLRPVLADGPPAAACSCWCTASR